MAGPATPAGADTRPGQPAKGLTSPATPDRGGPLGPPPEGAPAQPPPPPAVPAAVPSAPPARPGPRGYVEGQSRELPERRTETSREYANPDGTRATQVSAGPMNFMRDGAWTPIDSTVVADPAGGWRSAANSWTAHFGALSDGVAIESDRGAIRWQPRGAAAADPVVANAPGGGTVLYADAWPGVDLRYTVRPDGVKEEILLKRRGTASSFVFGTGGARPAADASRPGALRFAGLATGGRDWLVPPAEAFGADGRPAPPSAASLAAQDDPAAGPAVRVGVDPQWLAAQPDAAFPIALDPTTSMGGGSKCYKSDGTVVDPCQVQIGNPDDGHGMWRTVTSFNIGSVTGSARLVYGASVTLDSLQAGTANAYGAALNRISAPADSCYTCSGGQLQGAVGGTSYAFGDSWGDASHPVTDYYDSYVQGGAWDTRVLFAGAENAGVYTYKRFSYFLLTLWWDTKPGVAAPTTPSPANGASIHTLTPAFNAAAADADGDALQYDYVVSLGPNNANAVWDSGWVGAGQQTIPSDRLWWGSTYYWHAYASDGYWRTDPDYTWTFTVSNSPPAAPAPSSPGDNAVVTSPQPTLAVGAASDPDGDQSLQYQFRIVAGDDINSGLVIDSAWQSATSWQVPALSLQDGGTYTWTARARDQLGLPTSTGGFGPTRRFRYDLRLGMKSTLPYDTSGPVSVNLASGNVTTAISGPSLGTVGGPVGVTLAYDSQRPVASGLDADYYQDWNANGAIDANEKPLVHRVDPQVSFQWGTAGPAPGQVGPENFIGVWSGRLLLPSGAPTTSYHLVVDSTDTGTPSGAATGRATVWSGGAKVLDNASADFSHPTSAFTLPSVLKVQFAHGTGASNLVLRLYPDDGSQPSTAAVASAGVLRPDVAVLPDGWASTGLAPISAHWTRLSPSGSKQVAVLDGDGVSHVFTSSGAGWAPPADDQAVLSREGDGTWSLLGEDGYLYHFDAAGRLTGIDSVNDDLHPGALTYSWASPNNDGVQRLMSISDAAGRSLTFVYGNGTSSNTNCLTSSGSTTYDPAPMDQLCRVMYGLFGLSDMHLFYSGGHLARVVNPGDWYDGVGPVGPTWDFTYNSTGLLETVREPLTNQLMYTPLGGSPVIPVSDQDNLHHRTVVAYSSGRAASVTRPIDKASTADADRVEHDYSWTTVPGDANGLLASSEVRVKNLPVGNAAGYARHVDLDPSGLALHDLGPDGTGVDNTWDALKERLTATVDHHHQAGSAGFETTYAYDDADRLVATAGPASPAEIANGTAPVSRTSYDDGISGLAAAWYPNADLAGVPSIHTTSSGSESFGSGGPSRSGYYFPTNSFSGRLTGAATLAAPSKLEVAADGARLYVDDKLELDTWGGPYRVAVQADHPLDYWRLGDAAGSNTAADSAGFAPGTFHGLYALGTTGALRLDTDADTAAGFSSQIPAYLTLPSGFDNFTGGLTLEGWFKPAATPGANERLFDLGRGQSADNIILYRNGTSNDLTFAVFLGGTGYFLTAPGALTGGVWQHLAATLTPSGAATVYRNGTAVASGTLPVPSVVARTSNFIGRSNWSGDGYIHGQLDEMAVYPAALPAARVQAHYTAGTVPTSSTADSTDTIAAGTHRIRLEYQELSGDAALAVSAPAAGSALTLSPRYNLATTGTDPDGDVTRTAYSDASHGPEFGLPTSATSFPAKAAGGGSDTGGKQLVSTASYEAASPSGAYLRPTGRSLPNGAGTTVSYVYYGIGETADNPCPNGPTGIKQAGALKEEDDADPDGAGPQRRIVRQARYDLAGRVVATRSSTEDKVAAAAWECSFYDNWGRVTRSWDRTGKVTTADYYTRADRVTVTYTDSAGTARSTVAVLDWLGRPLSYTDEQGTTTRSEYDLAGRLVKKYRALPGQAEALLWETAYDGAGRTSMVKDYAQSPAATTSYSWDATGLVKTTNRLSNGVVTTSTVDSSRGRLSSVSNTKAAQGSTWGYSYTQAGRVSQEAGSGTLANRTRAFAYDAAGRLAQTAETGANPATRNYAYDDDGNRCARAASCAAPSYSYDSADRITSSPDYSSYAYDDYGNVVSAVPTTQPPNQQSTYSANFSASSSTAPTSFPITVGQAGTVTASMSTTGTPAPLSNSGSSSGSLSAGQTSPSTAMPVDGETRVTGGVSWGQTSQQVSNSYSDNVTPTAAATHSLTTSAVGNITAAAGWAPITSTHSESGTVTAPLTWGDNQDIVADANGTVTVHLSWDATTPSSVLWLDVYEMHPDGSSTLKGSSHNNTTTYQDVSFQVSDQTSYPSPIPHTYRAVMQALVTPTSGARWWLAMTYKHYATVGLELDDTSGHVLAPSSPTPGIAQRTLTYANAPVGSYVLKTTTSDYSTPVTDSETHRVSTYANVGLVLKDKSGTIVSQTSSSSGSASLAYNSPASGTGTYSWYVVDNSASLTVPSYTANWSTTTLADDSSSGSIAPGGSTTRPETADGPGYCSVGVSWTKGSHQVPYSAGITVAAGGTGSTTVSPDAAGAVSATYAWSPDRTSDSSAGSVAAASSVYGPKFTVSANGSVSATVTWTAPPFPQPNPEIDVDIVDDATNAVVSTGGHNSSGNTNTASFTQSGLSYGQSHSYKARITAPVVGSSYSLSESYGVWDQPSKLELLDAGGTPVASVAPPTSGTASATVSYATGTAQTYTARATSGRYRSTGTVSGSYQQTAFATVNVAVKNSSGAVVASATQSSGSTSYSVNLPSSGSYSVVLTNQSTDVAVPSYTLNVTTPRTHPVSATLKLLGTGNQEIATGSSANPSTLSSFVSIPGVYTLVVTPVSGSGTASVTATYPPAPATETITYDALDHATSIDDGAVKVTEVLSVTGRVLERKAVDDVSNAILEDTLYGYEDGGDSPAYTRAASGGVTTTYVEGADGLLAVDAGPSPTWLLYNGHGDVVATSDSAGALTAAPSTDEFGVGGSAVGQLGWLGAQQREAIGRLGLVRMGARLYDPSLGRFLQVDPVAGGSCSDYDYVCADPVNLFDLDGLYIDGYARWDAHPEGNQHAGSWHPAPVKAQPKPKKHSVLDSVGNFAAHALDNSLVRGIATGAVIGLVCSSGIGCALAVGAIAGGSLGAMNAVVNNKRDGVTASLALGMISGATSAATGGIYGELSGGTASSVRQFLVRSVPGTLMVASLRSRLFG